jgi:DNA-binding MarR family transcriptional regulator
VRARQPASGEALHELLFLTPQVFFKLRALGQREGAVNRWGGGVLGLLRSLHRDGPQTVPRLARTRPVARQRIQRLADELAAAGLVRFEANPAHRRSRLLALTPSGEALFRELDGKVRAFAAGLAPEFEAAEIASTTAVLRRLADLLDRALAGDGRGTIKPGARPRR